MAPDDTTSTSRLSLCKAAMSAASESSHSRLSSPAAESTSSEEPTLTTMRRKSFSDGVFGIVPSELFMAALCSMGTAASSWFAVVSFTEGEAMQLAVYAAVLVIALGSVLLGLDWVSAPMSPMLDTKAGLSAAAPPLPPAPSRPTIAVPNTPAPPVAPAPVQPNIAAPVNPPAPALQCEFRRPNYRAQPKLRAHRSRLGRRGRDRSTGRGAGTAGALQRECLLGRLSFIQGS